MNASPSPFFKTVGRSAPFSLYIYDCNLTLALVSDECRDGGMGTSIMAGKKFSKIKTDVVIVELRSRSGRSEIDLSLTLQGGDK